MTTNPYTGTQQVSKTTGGALVGAASGAALGALIGNTRTGGSSRKYAVRGAIAGALAGGVIGHYMDQQEAAIRQQLQGTGVSVTRVGNDLVLNMPSDITFKVNRSDIQPRFTSTLDSVALVFQKYRKTQVRIIGHTDSDGSHAYNQKLSLQRAYSVAEYFRARGVAPARLFREGMGETRPVAPNTSRSGKAKNRRVEVRIIPQQHMFQ